MLSVSCDKWTFTPSRLLFIFDAEQNSQRRNNRRGWLFWFCNDACSRLITGGGYVLVLIVIGVVSFCDRYKNCLVDGWVSRTGKC